MQEKEKATVIKSMALILSDWAALKRCLVFFFGLSVIGLFMLSLGTYIISRMLRPEFVEITSAGTIVFSSRNERTAVLALPAAAGWVDTGINIARDESISFNTSGLVNLAIHDLVQGAINDEIPFSTWKDSEGYEEVALPKTDKALLIAPNERLGAIIGYLQKQTASDPSWENPRPMDVFRVKNAGTITNHTGQSVRLWLTVNDLVLNEDSKTAFLNAPDIPWINTSLSGEEFEEKYREWERKWNKVVEKKYWNIWFDDNAGSFVVQAQVSN